MKILAIETSCDDTAASVVVDGRQVKSNVISSQIDIHNLTGGVVPEVAAREHLLNMIPVLERALVDADCSWDDIDAVAVTKGPGLVSSLIIGTETASVIAHMQEKPLIPVQHIHGHIYSNWLEIDEEVQLPALVLTVSGGHNELILVREHGDFEVLGRTRDDAAGEAFDKVARMLGLGYPGGPVISRLAEKGDKAAYDFPRVMLEKGSLDFSFSGLKTAVRNVVKAEIEQGDLQSEADFSEEFQANVAASFQECVVDILLAKLLRAIEQHPEIQEVHLAGGVSANLRLREKISEACDLKFRYPQQMSFCTDNAAMIGAAAYHLYQKDPEVVRQNVVPDTSWEV